MYVEALQKWIVYHAVCKKQKKNCKNNGLIFALFVIYRIISEIKLLTVVCYTGWTGFEEKQSTENFFALLIL